MWKKYCDDCRNINSDDAFTGTPKTSIVLKKPYVPWDWCWARIPLYNGSLSHNLLWRRVYSVEIGFGVLGLGPRAIFQDIL